MTNKRGCLKWDHKNNKKVFSQLCWDKQPPTATTKKTDICKWWKNLTAISKKFSSNCGKIMRNLALDKNRPDHRHHYPQQQKNTPPCTGNRWCLKLPFLCQPPSRSGWCTRWSSRAEDAANLSWRSVWCTSGKAWIWKHRSSVKAHRHWLRHHQTQVG